MEQATVQYELKNRVKDARFRLRDISGKLIREIPLVVPKGSILLEAVLSRGVYFGQIVSSGGSSAVLKIVAL